MIDGESVQKGVPYEANKQKSAMCCSMLMVHSLRACSPLQPQELLSSQRTDM